MEILTLLKANIRRKKGSFVSVILLTLIITMSVTTILSIKESAFKGINNAHEICDTPDVLVIYLSHNLTDDLLEKVKSDDRVKRVDIVESIFSGKIRMGNEDSSNRMSLIKANETTRLLKSDMNGIVENAPKLQKGEVYVPQGILTNLHGKVGEKIIFETIAGEYEFIVKGILLEPMMGASVIGYKNLCISDEDFRKLHPLFQKQKQWISTVWVRILKFTKPMTAPSPAGNSADSLILIRTLLICLQVL